MHGNCKSRGIRGSNGENQDFRFQGIENAGFGVPGGWKLSGFGVSAHGSWVPAQGFWVPVTGFRVPSSGYGVPVDGFWVPLEADGFQHLEDLPTTLPMRAVSSGRRNRKTLTRSTARRGSADLKAKASCRLCSTWEKNVRLG